MLCRGHMSECHPQSALPEGKLTISVVVVLVLVLVSGESRDAVPNKDHVGWRLIERAEGVLHGKPEAVVVAQDRTLEDATYLP